jgi:hypothetical protein
MRQKFSRKVKTARVTLGPLASNWPKYGRNGAFLLPSGEEWLRCIISDGGGWEHVSVSLVDRVPTWDEMCWVKSLFWDDEEAVMQLHPPKSDYVNHHPYCLHLWRPTTGKIPLPPSEMVGPKS